MSVQYVNLHRHDTFSVYDGFGTPKQAATYAKELGQPALGLTNHGNVCGLVDHYYACQEAGIKPVLGVEAYFQPTFDPKKPRYHMTLLVASNQGYRNLMRMLSAANANQFYRYPIVDWKLLERYSEGIILLSGCMSGFIPRKILAGKWGKAEAAARRFSEIFGDRFYLELQPISAPGQKEINENLLRLVKLAKPVLTSDAHYTRPDEYPSYEKMYELGGRKPSADYSGRHLLSAKQVVAHWRQMWGSATDPYSLMQETVNIAERCNVTLDFTELIPKIDWGTPSDQKLKEIVLDFVRKEYVDKSAEVRQRYYDRAEKELEVILGKGFQDYFLLCYDLVQQAKQRDIATGFGRGSVCGSLVAYALGLTRVDPLYFGTMFERFLRPDKNVMPDIDMDFGNDRRDELKQYVLQKFEGKAIPIITVGRYRAKNLWNDLAKLYEVDRDDTENVKMILQSITAGEQQGAYAELEIDDVLADTFLRRMNKKYPGIIEHFVRLYGQVRFMGEHPAGVAITAKRIDNTVTSMRLAGKLLTSYDMDALAKIKVIKMDILGLSTATIVKACEEATGVKFNYRIVKDEELYEEFRLGRTEGIFQFEKGGVRKIIELVQPDRFTDLVACNALNRPGTLPNVEAFVAGKNGKVDTSTPWYKFTKDTYGAIIYQEQVMRICRAAGMEWAEADKVMKSVNAKAVDTALMEKFIKGAKANFGLTTRAAEDLYRRSTLYLFNKSHVVGYTLIAMYQMYFKHYHPIEFWWATLKYEKDEYKQKVYQAAAIRGGVVVMPPHINATAHYSIEHMEGEAFIRCGLASIKNVGLKAALEIEKARPYEDELEPLAKLPRRVYSKRVSDALKTAGALEFDEERFNRRAVTWNSQLYASALEVR